MSVAAIQNPDVQCDSSILTKSPEELRGKTGFKFPGPVGHRRRIIDQERAVRQIQADRSQRLVHWDREMTVAGDSSPVAQGFRERQTQTDADVFDGVVSIDFEVAGSLYLQVEDPVDGKKRQHVVKKRDPRVDSALPVPSRAISAEI